jgi:poly [ADP-ribose] polymerase 6/8
MSKRSRTYSLNIFVQEEIAVAWEVIRTEPIIVRLHCSLTQYLNGPG